MRTITGWVLAILAALPLGGCVRSLDDVASLPVTEEVVTARPAQDVRDCLVRVMSQARVTPVETGSDGHRVLAFTGDNGVIAHYMLDELATGTRVTVRRRTMIADHYDEARACFAV